MPCSFTIWARKQNACGNHIHLGVPNNSRSLSQKCLRNWDKALKHPNGGSIHRDRRKANWLISEAPSKVWHNRKWIMKISSQQLWGFATPTWPAGFCGFFGLKTFRKGWDDFGPWVFTISPGADRMSSCWLQRFLRSPDGTDRNGRFLQLLSNNSLHAVYSRTFSNYQALFDLR